MATDSAAGPNPGPSLIAKAKGTANVKDSPKAKDITTAKPKAPDAAPNRMEKASWDDLRAVAELVRQGTLARAGAQLGVNYTTIARRIARAENVLNVQLFDRLADGYVPTERAHLVASHVQQMADSAHAIMRQLAGRDDDLKGRLTITAPQLLIAHALAPALQQFHETHPQIDLRVRATNDLLDLTRREADLGIRISPDPGDTLTGLRVTEQHTASFASPDWARRIATRPKDPIDWIVFEGHQGLPANVLKSWPNSRVAYRFDDMVAMLGAAQAGLGVVRAPMFLARAMPGLTQVPLLSPTAYPPIWVVAHPEVWKGAKVKAFRDHVVRFLKARRSDFISG